MQAVFPTVVGQHTRYRKGCRAGMAPGTASRYCWPLSTLVASLALPLASRLPVCESFAVLPTSVRSSAARFEGVHVHTDASHAAGQLRLRGSTKCLEASRARAWALASSTGDQPWRRELVQEDEDVSREGLQKLRSQIDEGLPASQTTGTLTDDVIVRGQELLTTEASVILQRCPRLTEAAKVGEFAAELSSAASRRAESDFLLLSLQKELVAELDTPWAASVKKWRQKALAVEKYRSTNPTANAVVYTYMTNCCLRQGMWEVAYDALTYAGLMSAGPFFVARKDVGLGGPSVVLDMDKMACYVAEKILDIDLDVWRRRGGDLTAGAETVGNNKPGVGIEERNFSQNDDSASHLAALRVQDMTLAAGRVALRKIRAELRDSAAAAGPDADASGSGLVVLASATTNALHLGELLLPVRTIETLLALDFAEPVRADAELGQRLADDAAGAAGSALGLLQGASLPVVVSGDALKRWLAQSDDVRVEDA